jgi:hypothetical protein
VNIASVDTESMGEVISSRAYTRWFFFMVTCSQITGVVVVGLIAFLFAQYRGGFEWGVRVCLFECLDNKC